MINTTLSISIITLNCTGLKTVINRQNNQMALKSIFCLQEKYFA